jgi:hypothetical protein
MKSDRMPARAGVSCAAAVALALNAAAQSAHAANVDYQVDVGAGYSDNIGRTATAEQDETIATAGLQFSLDERTSRLTADVIGDFAYYEYLDDTFDSEVTGNLAGTARFAFVPERFEWVVADNFGQVLSDPFSPATPDNRENINVFTTGPDFSIGLGPQMRAHLGARYALTTYEDRPFDSDIVSGELGLTRLLSSSSSISLQGQAQSVEYDQAALNADYDQRDVFVRYDATGARTHLKVDLGYTEVKPDSGESEDGLLLRLDVARRLSPSSTATLSAGREFSNSGTAFSGIQGAGGIGLEAAPGLQTAQPFTNTRVALGYDFSRNRTGFNLAAGWFDQSYDDASALDQTLTTLSAQVRRDLSSRASVTVRGLYARAEFNQSGGDYDELNAGVNFTLRMSSVTSLALVYDHWDRSGNTLSSDYDENRFWLLFAYGRGTPRTTPNLPEFGIDQ